MDYQGLVLGAAALLISGYGAHQTRKQTKLLETQVIPRGARRRGEIPSHQWWKSPAYPALFLLVVLAWLPWFLTQFGDKPLVVGGWGPREIISDASGKVQKITLFVSFNGYSLDSFRDAYSVIGIAFHNYGDRDIDDIQNVQKSYSYGIHSEFQTILIPTNEQYLNEVNKGDRMTTYGVLIMPDAVSHTNFETIRQAKAMGAIYKGIGSGPP